MRWYVLLQAKDINLFLVEGNTKNYFVSENSFGEWRCTCPSFLFRSKECKHILQIKEELNKEKQ
jgi:predicted nucleic acid-binding Zn finger protein